MGPLAFGIGLGFGFAAWRNLAPISHSSRSAFAVVVLAAVLFAYLGGRRRGKGGSVAVAIAKAEAVAVATGGQAAVQVVVVNGEAGARVLAERAYGGLDHAEWASAPGNMLEQVADDMGALDDIDPAEWRSVIEQRATVPVVIGGADAD